MKKIGKVVLSAGVALVILFFVFRKVDFKAFLVMLSEVSFVWVAISIAISFFAYLFRAIRWNQLLAISGNNIPLKTATAAIVSAYLANLIFPRLGEVTRCAAIKGTNDVPLATSLGTVISERVFDLLTLIFLLLLGFLFEYSRLISFISKLFQISEFNIYHYITLFVVFCGLLALMYVLYLVSPRNLKVRISHFFSELWKGVQSSRFIERKGQFFIYTIGLWVVYYFMSYLIVFSLPVTSNLPWTCGIMLLVTGGLAFIIPVQGGIGTYHFFISTMLALYNIDITTGLFLATLLHTSQIIAVVIFGAISSIYLGLKSNKFKIQVAANN